MPRSKGRSTSKSPTRRETRGRTKERNTNSQNTTDSRSRSASKSPLPKKVTFAPSVSGGMSSSASGADPSAGSPHYEFGGPIGALGIIFGLPLVIYLLYFASSNAYTMVTFSNLSAFDVNDFASKLPTKLTDFDSNSDSNTTVWLTTTSIYIFMSWLLLQVILERVLPGDRVVGVAPHYLPYTISGHLQFWITLALLFFTNCDISWKDKFNTYVISTNITNAWDLSVLYDEYLGLITISCLFSFILSFYVYIVSFIGTRPLAEGGNTGNIIYDFFIGRELNPRIGSLDIKEFCELRPGLIGWAVLNMGMAFKQYKENGGFISVSMALVVLYQGLYVWDALFNERAILTTMDITTDGFGYMLAFGDLAWVPFIYSLQARYLVENEPYLSIYQLIAISTLHFVGMYIFRSANSEKDAFRRDPDGINSAHLEWMPTKRGTKLLVSGWWGMARKINYTGDWLVTLSWCMLCGFDSPIPYFQAIYFLILLIHRANRDDLMCAAKYGDDWLEYKKKVPYVFVPGLY
jgi:Delta14-sterol reductase